jgi:two-component system CheB/CheR fusion protein
VVEDDKAESVPGSERPVDGNTVSNDSAAATPIAETASAVALPVVGVGASAGGLEAFQQMLHALPTDTGMAFVLVQHLDPTHASRLTEILSRATAMPVHEVSDGLRVQPNHVYVIPPGATMAIRRGVLGLSRRIASAGQHRPVDHFFQSLAEDLGPREPSA